MRKIVWIGHLLDRYDQTLFAWMAPILAPLFFPFEDPVYNLIATFCLLPLGLISKPIGAYVFGRLGDKYGYQKSFSTTLLGMALVTGSIAFLPTYHQIGVWAPILLALSRLLQNFFSAGETTGAAINALTDIPEKKKTFISSLVDASGILGTLLGSLICTLSLYNGISWRALFLTGFLAGIVGWLIRRKTALPKQVFFQTKNSWSALWKYKREIVSIAAVSGFSYANYYLITIFFNGFLPLIGIASASQVMAINTWMLGIDLCLLPLIGFYVKSRDRWMRISLLLAALFAIPLYLILDLNATWTWIVVRMAFMILGVSLSAPYHAWSLDVAPPEHRYLVKAMGNAIGSRLLGAPAPALALWLYHFLGFTWAPALIVLITALSALTFFLPAQKRETYATDA